MAVPALNEILEKNVLELMDLQDIPEEQKQEWYEKIAATIQNRVILRLDEVLGPEDGTQWAALVESGDRTQMDAFLAERNIDLERMTIEEAAIFKTQLVVMLDEAQADQASKTE